MGNNPGHMGISMMTPRAGISMMTPRVGISTMTPRVHGDQYHDTSDNCYIGIDRGGDRKSIGKVTRGRRNTKIDEI